MTSSRKTRLLLGLSLFVLSWPNCTPQPCLELKAREEIIRRHAVRQVLPAFPTEAVTENASGVTVAQVHIDAKGILRSVEILQAPHPAIAQATLEALKQWQFEFYPNDDGTPECFNGKLTFYSIIEDGKAFVRNPLRFQKM